VTYNEGTETIFIMANDEIEYLYKLLIKEFVSIATEEHIKLFKSQHPGFQWQYHEGESFKEVLDKEIMSYMYDNNHKKKYTNNIVDLKIKVAMSCVYNFMKSEMTDR